jgi:hypothetical protein
MNELLTMVRENWQTIAVSAGPLTGSLLLRLLVGKNRALLMVVNGSAAWLTIRVALGPHMEFVKTTMSSLIQITAR